LPWGLARAARPTDPLGCFDATVSHFAAAGCTVKRVTRVHVNLLGLAVVLALAILRPARAAEPGVLTLSWQGPAGCPSRDELREGIARLLGGDIRVPQGGKLEARALVTHGQTWAVEIETELAGQPGHRSIEAASCHDLANATALIVALMIDPDAVAAHATQPRPVVATPPADVSAKGRSPTNVLLGIHAAGSQGTLPSWDAGLGAELGLAGRFWRAELRGTYGLRRDQKAGVAAPAGAFGQFNFVSAALAGCFNLRAGGLAYGPCLDAEAGMVSAQGFGISQSLPAHTLWLALGGGLYASLPLRHRLSLPLHLDVLAPLRRSEFVFKDETGKVTSRVFQAPVAGGRLSAGIELSF